MSFSAVSTRLSTSFFAVRVVITSNHQPASFTDTFAYPTPLSAVFSTSKPFPMRFPWLPDPVSASASNTKSLGITGGCRIHAANSPASPRQRDRK